MDSRDTGREHGAGCVGGSRRTNTHSRRRRGPAKDTERQETTNRVSQGSRRNLAGDRDNYSFTLELPQDENLEQILYGEVVDGSLTVSVRPPYPTKTTQWSSQIPTFREMMKTGKRLYLTIDHLTHIFRTFRPRDKADRSKNDAPNDDPFKADVSEDNVYTNDLFKPDVSINDLSELHLSIDDLPNDDLPNNDLSNDDLPDLPEAVAELETVLRLLEKEVGEWPVTSIQDVMVNDMIRECRDTLNYLKTSKLDEEWPRDLSKRFESMQSDYMCLVNRYAESIMWVAASDEEFARKLWLRKSIWFKRLDPNMTNGFIYTYTHPKSVRALSNSNRTGL